MPVQFVLFSVIFSAVLPCYWCDFTNSLTCSFLILTVFITPHTTSTLFQLFLASLLGPFVGARVSAVCTVHRPINAGLMDSLSTTTVLYVFVFSRAGIFLLFHHIALHSIQFHHVVLTPHYVHIHAFLMPLISVTCER